METQVQVQVKVFVQIHGCKRRKKEKCTISSTVDTAPAKSEFAKKFW
jgi:hypothetical protein